MADISDRVANFVNETDTANPVLSAEFDFVGKRNISFQLAVPVAGFNGTATAVVKIEHSLVGGDSLDVNANWKTLATFTTVNTTDLFPSSEILSLIDNGVKKYPGMKGRVSLVLAGTTPDFTAEVYMAYDQGVTE